MRCAQHPNYFLFSLINNDLCFFLHYCFEMHIYYAKNIYSFIRLLYPEPYYASTRLQRNVSALLTPQRRNTPVTRRILYLSSENAFIVKKSMSHVRVDEKNNQFYEIAIQHCSSAIVRYTLRSHHSQFYFGRKTSRPIYPKIHWCSYFSWMHC